MAADAGKSETEMNHTGSDLSANGGRPGEGDLELTGGATEDDAPESVPSGPGTTELENTGSDTPHSNPSSGADFGSSLDATDEGSADAAPVDGLPNTASAVAYSDATPVNGLPSTTPIDGPPNDAPVNGLPDTATVYGPPDDAFVAGLLDDVFVDGLLEDTPLNIPSDVSSVDDSQYLVIDEGYEWALPPWGLNYNSFFQYITPEEEERADELLRRLLDRTRGKPWRIGTKFIAKSRTGRLRRTTEKLAQGSGNIGINRGKLVKFRYLL
jgi:hypothetical protein